LDKFLCQQEIPKNPIQLHTDNIVKIKNGVSRKFKKVKTSRTIPCNAAKPIQTQEYLRALCVRKGK
jgi:hypothetical protein